MPETAAVAEFKTSACPTRPACSDRVGRLAVEHVSLRIHAAEVFALLGPNRAGKTTLVKILLSLCRPTTGRALRFQRPLSDRKTLARVGYVHENPAFPRYLTPQALLECYGAMSFLSEAVAAVDLRKRIPLLEKVGLADRAREPISKFSKGMVQRLALAQALLNDPELLVLDEPSEGLDLPGRRLVRDVIAERRQRGFTVLLISHLLGEVGEICDRVGVIVAGHLVHAGAVADLGRDPGTGAVVPIESALERLYAPSQSSRGEPPMTPPNFPPPRLPLADSRHPPPIDVQLDVLGDVGRQRRSDPVLPEREHPCGPALGIEDVEIQRPMATSPSPSAAWAIPPSATVRPRSISSS